MSSTANPLGVFCDQLIAFFEDLTETYPEERDIATATSALKLLRRSNPRLIHTYFMTSVHKEFARHIMNEEDDYILRRAHDILNSQYAEINYAFWIFDKHWSSMTETNKSTIWKYMKSLILLAERVPAA
jgi:hypothetical protein